MSARVLFLGFLSTLLLLVPTSASADIYWSNELGAPNAIGHASSDGTGADDNFVPAATAACDVAVDSNYVYWTGSDNLGPSSGAHVGRASLATRKADNDFIETLDGGPCGVAVNGSHIYFVNFDFNNFPSGAIGRADLDGTAIEPSFISDGVNPQHPYVSGGNLFWTNKGFGGCPPGCTVGMAPTSGSPTNQNFITGTHDPPSGVAADSTHVYWGNGDFIGRASASGAQLEPTFLDTGDFVCDVAVDDKYIYWARYGDNGGPGSIGRAKIDGSNPNPDFIVTAGRTCGVAVSSSADFKFTEVPRVSCAGTCRVVIVRIKFDSSGNVVAEQVLPNQRVQSHAAKKRKRLIRTLSKSVKAGKNKLKLKLTKAGKKRLKKKGKLKVKTRFTFTAEGGASSSQTKTIKINRKHK